MDANHEIELIQQGLERLTELDALTERVKADKQRLIDAVLTDDQKQQIKDINSEFKTTEDATQSKYDQIALAIKEMTGKLGISVTGIKYQAVYYPDGKTSVDMKMINELAKTNPKIRMAFSQGDPYVVIKRNPAKKSDSQSA